MGEQTGRIVAKLLAVPALLMALSLGSTLKAAENPNIKVVLEQPVAHKTATGIEVIRGWALALAGIKRVELYIDKEPDGSPDSVLAYGGSRADVCNVPANAGMPDCNPNPRAGFAAAWNYNLHSAGEHEFTVQAFDNNGDHNTDSATFTVATFGEEFVEEGRFSLPAFELTNLFKDLGDPSQKKYNVEFEWRPAAQEYAIRDVSEQPDRIAFLKPTAPSGLTASKSSGNVELAWTDDTGFGTPGDERWFVVERRFNNALPGSPGEFEVIAVVPGGKESYIDDEVNLTSSIVGSSFTYRVIAYQVHGPSDPSNTASVNTERPVGSISP